MEYMLMHGKTAVAEMEIDEETAVIAKIGAVYHIEHIPVGVSVKGNVPDRGDLNDWWQGRSIPASRQNIREALKALNVTSSKKLLTRCFGLSLSDQYWVNPVKNPLEWEKINFFDNAFSEDVGNALFGAFPQGDAIDLISPNNTSDGWLKKKWEIVNGKRCLIKGGSDPFWQQPINEVLATKIMQRLNIPHAAYSLIWHDGLPYSVCDNLVNRDTELVSAYDIHNTQKIADPANLYQHYTDCCASLGINAQLHLDTMLTVDFLIANSDRHLGNFGAIRNAATLDWLSPAPLYDNGSSLWYNQGTINCETNKSQPFLLTHEEQIKLVKDFSWLNLSDLSGIDDEFNALLALSPLIDTPRRSALCFALQSRVGLLKKHMDIAVKKHVKQGRE